MTRSSLRAEPGEADAAKVDVGKTDATPGPEARLIAAAEGLFAEHGVGAVSLRAVMAEAGVNVASVHYYFGSKQALLEAVVTSRLEEVARARETVLASFPRMADPSREPTAHDPPADRPRELPRELPRQLAEALVRPVIAVAENGGRDWIKLIGALLGTGDPGLAPIAETFFERNRRLEEMLQRCDPDASPQTLSFRLTQAMVLTLHVLGDPARVRSLLSSAGQTWSTGELTSQLVDVVASILTGPTRPTGERC